MGATAAAPIPTAALRRSARRRPHAPRRRRRRRPLVASALVVGAIALPRRRRRAVRPERVRADRTSCRSSSDDTRRRRSPTELIALAVQARDDRGVLRRRVAGARSSARPAARARSCKEHETVTRRRSRRARRPSPSPPSTASPEGEAELLLEAPGFVVDENVERVFDETVEKGIVHGARTRRRRSCPKGSTVTSTVSDGPRAAHDLGLERQALRRGQGRHRGAQGSR